MRAFHGDKMGDGSSRDGKNKIIKNRSEDELCLTRKGRRGGWEEDGLEARSESSGFHVLSLPPSHPVLCGSILKHRCRRYQTYPYEDHLSYRKFWCLHRSALFFPPYGSTSISFRPSACGFFPGGGLFGVFADSSPLFFNAFVEKFFPAEESGRSVSFWQLQFETAKFFLVDVLKGQFT